MGSVQDTKKTEIHHSLSPYCNCNKLTVEDSSSADIDHPFHRFYRCPQFKMPNGCSFKQFKDEALSPYYKGIINNLLSQNRLKTKEIEALKGSKKKFEGRLRQNNLRWTARLARAARRMVPVPDASEQKKHTADHRFT